MHLGEFLIEKELVAQEDLIKALDIQQTKRLLLGQLAVQRDMISSKDLLSVLTEQRKMKRTDERYFGEVAVEMGFLTEDQVKALVREQNENKELLGDILISQGSLDKVQFIEALKEFRKLKSE